MRVLFRRKADRSADERMLTIERSDWSLNAFLTSLLREYAVIAGVDPGFRMLSESRRRALAGRVAERLMEDRASLIMELGVVDGDTTLIREAFLRLHQAGGIVPARTADPRPFAEALGRCCMDILAPLANDEDAPEEIVNRIRSAAPGLMLAANRLVESFDWKALRKLRTFRGMFRPRGGFHKFEQSLICARQALDQLIGACLDGQSARCADTMVELVAEFETRYSAEKAGLGVMDVADLHAKDRAICTDIPEIAERLRAEYPVVRVPDWSDWTDDERETISSIWPSGALIIESQQWPSARPGITAFVDYLFSEINSEDGEKRRVAHPKSRETDVELIILPTPYVRTPDATYRRHRREAAAIAERMLQLNSEGTAWRDMVVILPSGWDAATYERELLRRCIPVCALAGYGFYDAPEVRDALNVLRLTADPENPDALFHVLGSPFVGLTERTLAGIRDAAFESPDLPLWRALLESAPADDADSRRLKEFFQWMPELVARSDSATAGELLDTALSATSFDLKLLAMPLGLKRYANIRKLRQNLAEPVGLEEFLAGMDESDRLGIGEQEARLSAPDENAVRIMTINQTSGQHYPVVFLPDLSRRLGGARSIYAFDSDRGLAVAPVADNGQRWMSLNFRETEAAAMGKRVEDEMTRLHTAMARAAEKLILIGCTDLNPNPRRAYSETLSAMGWIERALNLGPQSRAGALNVGPCTVDLRFVDPSAPMQPTEERATLALSYSDDLRECLPVDLPPDTAISEAVSRCLQTPSTPAVRLSRLSVSQALDYMECPARFRYRHILGMPDEPSEPPDDLGEDEYSAADLGQAVHDALSRVDFSIGIGFQLDELTAVPHMGIRAEMRELLTRFGESKWWAELAAADELLREIPFEIMVEGKVFAGRIDAIYRQGAAWTVLDYKTGRGEDKARYEMQVGMYAHALHRLLGVMPARSALALLTTGGEWVRDTSDGESARTALDSVKQAVRSLDEAIFTSQSGEYCRWCACSRTCPQESVKCE